MKKHGLGPKFDDLPEAAKAQLRKVVERTVGAKLADDIKGGPGEILGIAMALKAAPPGDVELELEDGAKIVIADSVRAGIVDGLMARFAFDAARELGKKPK